MTGLTKQQGQSTHNYRYDAYGQLLPTHGNFTDPHNHYTFSGKEWDEHLDSYEFGYRQYDPVAGVWLTQDPLRGEPQRPRTLHRYQYVFASPISYRDAYGLQVEPPDCEPGEICYTGTTGPYTVQSTPYTSLPTGAYPEECISLSGLVRTGTDIYQVGEGAYLFAHGARLFGGGLRFVGGSAYPGQVIVYGTREARAAAGIFPYLTHASATHSALIGYTNPWVAAGRAVGGRGTAVTLGFVYGVDVYEYGWGSKADVGLDSSEFISAMTADTAIQLGPPAAGAAIGSAFGPVGTAVGAGTGALVSVAWGTWGRESTVNWVDENIWGPVQSASEEGVRNLQRNVFISDFYRVPSDFPSFPSEPGDTSGSANP